MEKLCGATFYVDMVYVDMAKESGTSSVTSEARPVDKKPRISCACGGTLRVQRFKNVEEPKESALVERTMVGLAVN